MKKNIKSIPVNYAKSLLYIFIDKLQNKDETDGELNILYTITVQGIKNALLSVRENQLAEAAGRLEQAGKENDTEFIISDTPAFLKVLKLVAMSFKM